MSHPGLLRQLTLIANMRLPSEKAHVIQIIHMAAAFARVFQGARLVYPVRANTGAMLRVKDVVGYYGAEKNFALVGVPCLDLVKRVTIDWKWLGLGPIPMLAHLMQLLTFTVAAFFYVARLPAGAVYSRDLFPLTVLNLLLSGRDRLFVFEVHSRPRSALAQKLHLWSVRRASGIVAISDHLRDWYLDHGFAPDRVMTARDGVDLARFLNLPDKESARRQLGIDSKALVACYTGHFYRWKGVDTLVEAAAMLPEPWQVWLVGGIDPDLERIRARARAGGRICVVGHLPQHEAAAYLAASDVAVLPNSAAEPISARYTSPLKLFEYMAAGKPVVASDLPSIGEVLRDGLTALLVDPDSPAALARGICRIGAEPELAGRLAAAARDEAMQYAWESRAENIHAFMGRLA